MDTCTHTDTRTAYRVYFRWHHSLAVTVYPLIQSETKHGTLLITESNDNECNIHFHSFFLSHSLPESESESESESLLSKIPPTTDDDSSSSTFSSSFDSTASVFAVSSLSAVPPSPPPPPPP